MSLSIGNRAPEDPIFQMTFPQRRMLSDVHFNRMAMAIRSGMDKKALQAVANEIRADLKPPSGRAVGAQSTA